MSIGLEDRVAALRRGDGRHPAVMRALLRMWIALAVACGGGSPDASNSPLDGGDAALQRLEVTPVNPQLPVSTAQQLTATGVFSDQTTRDLTRQVTWTWDPSDVLAVSASGRATAIAAGTATVTASSSGVTGTTTVTVTPATLVAVAVLPGDPRIPVGMAERLVAIGTYSDATTHDLTEQAAWASESPAIVEASNLAGARGTVTARSAGTTRITAQFAGVTGETAVTAVAVTLSSIEITAQAIHLPIGETQRLTAIGTFSDTTTRDLTAQVTWSSDAAAIIEVSNAAGVEGTATARALGTARITATLSGMTGVMTLTATSAAIAAIAVSPVTSAIAAGLSRQLTATGTFSDGTMRDVTNEVTWSSDAPARATVSNAAATRGLVTTHAFGQAQITAALGGVRGTTTLTVTLAALVSIEIRPADLSLAIGQTQLYDAIGRFSDGGVQDVSVQASWGVSDQAVALIFNDNPSDPNHLTTAGFLRARGVGHVKVTAAFRGVVGTAELSVTPVAPVSVSIQPAGASLPAGFARRFTAIETFTDTSTQNVTDRVTRSIDAPCATVSNLDSSHGLVTATSPCFTILLAAIDGLTTGTRLVVTSAKLTFLGPSPTSASVPVGLTVHLTATGQFDDGSTLDLTDQVTWTSQTPALAQVSNQAGSHGAVTGLAEGSTTITAAIAGVSNTVPLRVAAAAPVAIAIAPEDPQVPAGLTLQLAAIGTLADGTIADVTESCTWTSSSATNATVSTASGSRGLVTGVRPAAVQIVATMNFGFGVQTVGSASLRVTQPVVVSLLPQFFGPYPVGTATQLTVLVVYSAGANLPMGPEVTWSSDNPAVASTTTTGVLTAHAIGTARITASFEGVSATRSVSVIAPALVSVAISPDGPSLATGRSLQLALTGTFTDGATRDLTAQATWTSLSPTIATVTATGTRGLVKAVAHGSATIRASIAATGDQPAVSDDDTVTVTAPALDSLAVSPAQASLAIGQTRAFTARGTFSDLSTLDLTGQVTWASSAPDVATITTTGTRGVATAVATGTTSITAALGTVTSPAAALGVTASAAAPLPIQ